MSTSVEETFVFGIFFWVENVVAFCAGSEGCHYCREKMEPQRTHGPFSGSLMPYLKALESCFSGGDDPFLVKDMTQDEDHAEEWKDLLALVVSNLVDSIPLLLGS